MWAIRCVHEAKDHDQNCFITLTYNSENLPRTNSLVKKHFQDFMKRFRKTIEPQKIKFYMCGEYGDLEKRPHYHACIFGYDLPDKELWSVRDDIPLYTSDLLSDIWGKGFVTIGDVTFESAAYVARYIMKKVNGDLAEKIDEKTGLKHYERCHLDTGEIIEVIPEYTTMSRGGRKQGSHGIGYSWFNRYRSDVYPNDSVVINGHENRPPRYYDNLFEIQNPDEMERIKEKRIRTMREHIWNNTPERLQVREKVKQAQLSQLIRS